MDPRFNYVHGSAAPKLPDSPVREEQRVRRKRPVRKKVVQPEVVAFPLKRMIACILIGFMLVFVIISRFSAITEMNCRLSALAGEYETLKDSNRRLQAEIGSKINLEKVRMIAENELNMKMPDSYHRIPVKVPRVNYSLVNQEIGQDTKSILKSLMMACFGQ
ncbi:MAG: cell division protein FtsL [Clostridiaceae bacterium]|nr:cell division protein FtsL [Clostridiaceae bacterium]